MPRLVDQIVDSLLPPRCLLCNEPGRRRSFCADCHADLPWLDAPAAGARLRAALSYEYPVDRLVTGAKFLRRAWSARALGELLADSLAARPPVPQPDFLVPVPLHRRRLGQRGFNQALEIARPVAAALGLRIDQGLCRRVRATPEQSGLSAAERRRNLRGAFAVTRRLAGAHVAIIDDVVTTGSTVAALARALQAAGAVTVEVWAVALTPLVPASRSQPGRNAKSSTMPANTAMPTK